MEKREPFPPVRILTRANRRQSVPMGLVSVEIRRRDTGGADLGGEKEKESRGSALGKPSRTNAAE
jgi:hypothetical protein